MHPVTERVLKIMWQLESAMVEDPDFALMLSFQEARELYYDLNQYHNMEVWTYVPVSLGLGLEKSRRNLPGRLDAPPYPNGKRVMWAQCDGLKIGIKGTEDA